MDQPVETLAPAHPPARFVRDRTTQLLYAALCAFGALQTVPSLATPALRDEFGYSYGLSSAHLSVFAAGFTTSFAPMMNATSVCANSLLMSSSSNTSS